MRALLGLTKCFFFLLLIFLDCLFVLVLFFDGFLQSKCFWRLRDIQARTSKPNLWSSEQEMYILNSNATYASWHYVASVTRALCIIPLDISQIDDNR